MGYSETSGMRKHFISHGPDETKKIGAEIGRLLRPGDVVGLYGELGAGKTTLIKGIASVLGLNEREIASASFTIIAEYETVPPLAHIDLYRVENQTELDELGLWEYLGSDCITVVEWAERAAALLPEDLIKITLEYSGENSREIVIEGNYEKHRDNL